MEKVNVDPERLKELAARLEKAVQEIDDIREQLECAHEEEDSEMLNADEIALRAKLDIAWLEAEHATTLLEEAYSLSTF